VTHDELAGAPPISRASSQAATLMPALSYTSFSRIFCGHYAIANALIDELAALADEKGAALWKAAGMMNRGWLFAVTGKASDAVQMITSGIAAWRSTGSTLWMPLYLQFLARAHSELSQFEDAWRCIDEAITAVEASKEKWCEAELLRTAGVSR
jgi:predicted ATPase